ncbi:peptidoglycan-binding protein [Kitasatospora sp. NPDC101801]|uniref:peptidoglycan-binding protein n=1 Tax=Kitasatospora sp. NPDC101801 TaxID=3364103 RepID=UPI003801A5DE
MEQISSSTPEERQGQTVLIEFTEIEPDRSCACAGCSARRLARMHGAGPADGGHRSAHGARRVAVLFAAVGTVLGGGAAAGATGTAPAPRPSGSTTGSTPQGEVSPLFGRQAEQAPRLRSVGTTTRTQILARAQRWVDQQVPYSMSSYWSDGYRQDCSGFVSMAWGLGSSQTTWTLPDFATRIGRSELQPGDALIYNNPANPGAGSHTVIFGGWTNAAQTQYTAYEQTRPGTRKRATPYAYWSNSASYVAYRYRGLDGPRADDFPGADKFGPGQSNRYVQQLGEMLVTRGAGRFYGEGPDPTWGEPDRRATEAFQLAQGWRGSEADGLPGKDTWDYLVNGKGRDIPAAAPPPPPAGGVPPYPGADAFGPGRSNESISLLGRQLVQKGFGRHYTEGPGPSWSESDRLNVADFQTAQGWTGSEADGLPGPHTWRLLFG